MAGFINVRIPLLLRRAMTMVPALVVLAVGVNPTSALVLSQVVLSFGIPFALIPLVMLTCRRDMMGVHVNRRLTTILAWACAGVITALNVFLLYQQFFWAERCHTADSATAWAGGVRHVPCAGRGARIGAAGSG